MLAEDRYQIVGVMDGDACPALDFLLVGEVSTKAARTGLAEMLEKVAELGLQGVPSKWTHEANKKEGIYEFVKGPLRLFFFKGDGKQIAVCTSGVRKSGQKADPQAVNKAVSLKDDYFSAKASNKLKVVDDETE